MRRHSTRIWDRIKKLVKPARKQAPFRYQRRLELEWLEGRLTPTTTNLTSLNVGVISGQVFVDSNGNHVRDAGELAIPGVTIRLTGTTTAKTQVNLSATTDSNGNYTFFQVQPGTYQLSAQSLGDVLGGASYVGNLGGTASAQSMNTINLAGGQVALNYNFAVRGVGPSSISLADFMNTSTANNPFSVRAAGSGTAFADGLNQPASESAAGTASLSGVVSNASTKAGISGALVALTGVDYFGKALMLTTTTGANGSYQFEGLRQGDYTIDVAQLPAGFRAGPATAGSLGGITPLNTQITGIQIAAGQAGTNYNFAEIPSASASTGTGPALAAELADKTGANATDGITSDATIQGSVSTNGRLASLVAQVDHSSSTINLTGQLDATGHFIVNTAQLDQAGGGKLANGAHTVTLTAVDSQGKTSTMTVQFTLERTAPATPTIDFGGTDRLGDMGTNIHVAQQSTTSSYTITGTATAGLTIELLGVGQPLTTTADSAGKFTFNNVHLTSIVNELTALAVDAAGNFGSKTATFVIDNIPTKTSIPTQTLKLSSPNGTVLDLNSFFSSQLTTDTTIQYNTSSGPIQVQLFDTLAPKTVANFLSYATSTVTNRTYTNSFFDRLIPNFVLQGGSFDFNTTTNTLTGLSPNSPVDSEAKVPGAKTNVTGTIAMALQANSNGTYQLNSATSAYFFNLVDNPSLNGPFTVFGQVIDGQSMRVINTLAAFPTRDETSTSGALANLPLENYTGVFPNGLKPSNLAFINSISTIDQSESANLVTHASGFDAKVISVILANNQLTIKPIKAGTTSIFVSAVDRFGLATNETIQVTVTA
jgi:cyclophilin family peptidyl-prolyl cis-trans isomerase